MAAQTSYIEHAMLAIPVYCTNCSPKAMAGMAEVNKMYVEGARILQGGLLFQPAYTTSHTCMIGNDN